MINAIDKVLEAKRKLREAAKLLRQAIDQAEGTTGGNGAGVYPEMLLQAAQRIAEADAWAARAIE